MSRARRGWKNATLAISSSMSVRSLASLLRNAASRSSHNGPINPAPSGPVPPACQSTRPALMIKLRTAAPPAELSALSRYPVGTPDPVRAENLIRRGQAPMSLVIEDATEAVTVSVNGTPQ
jgi:hypothetical protein